MHDLWCCDRRSRMSQGLIIPKACDKGVGTASSSCDCYEQLADFPNLCQTQKCAKEIWLEFESPGMYVVDVVGRCIKGFESQIQGSWGWCVVAHELG